jgi:hypothetical protein
MKRKTPDGRVKDYEHQILYRSQNGKPSEFTSNHNQRERKVRSLKHVNFTIDAQPATFPQPLKK